METKEDLENMVYQVAFEMKELRQDLRDAERDIRRIKHQVYVVMRGPSRKKLGHFSGAYRSIKLLASLWGRVPLHR